MRTFFWGLLVRKGGGCVLLLVVPGVATATAAAVVELAVCVQRTPSSAPVLTCWMPAMAVGECAFPLCPRRSPSSLWEQRLHFSRLLSHKATVCVSAAHAPARARARPLSRLRSSRGGRWRSFFISYLCFWYFIFIMMRVYVFFSKACSIYYNSSRRFPRRRSRLADFRCPSTDENARKGGERARSRKRRRRPVDGGNVMSRVRPTAADVVDRTSRTCRRRWRPTTTTRPRT